ncbi:hypothetical protein HMPREF9371_0932 [Neisseria shayeganii 871]|uniref:Uncharacterized protein n=1 Tax=Neisseria shayeganii 871 TaxID=1032488 RepID=G4CH43_9NEIS|nr:hypothetical protein HMPREF9371_0932 [Neisseria shayeganii 871]
MAVCWVKSRICGVEHAGKLPHLAAPAGLTGATYQTTSQT